MIAIQQVQWQVIVKRFFIETGEVNKKGKPIRRPVVSRKLFLKNPNAFLDSGDYRITARGSLFTVSLIPRKEQSCWTNPSGKVKNWYLTEPDYYDDEGEIKRPFVRSDDPPMDSEMLLNWLSKRIGEEQATEALFQFLTAEPE